MYYTSPSTKEKEVEIVGYMSTAEKHECIIPEKIDGKSVSRLSLLSFNSSSTSVEIPFSMTEIDGNVFRFFTQLGEIRVDSENKKYCSIDGMLYAKDKSKLYICPRMKKVADGVLKIPSTVQAIGDWALYGCNDIQKVKIPASVTEIGNAVSMGCNKLYSIEVDADNQSFCSENGILYNKEITELYVCPEAKTGQIEIASGVKIIRNMAFCGCSGLSSIELTEGVTSIGDYAFDGCSGLRSIEIPGNVMSIGEFAFNDCSGLSSIKIPKNVTSIGESAFASCSKLSSIELSENITSIEKSTFGDCSGLSSVKVPQGVIRIGESAFEYCSGLSSIEIPESVISIEEYAFYCCRGLSSVEIPESVTSIGEYAFFGCSNLKDVTVLSKCEFSYDYEIFDKEMQLTIHCRPGSGAEEYARQMGISYDYDLNHSNDNGDGSSDVPDSGAEKPSDSPTGGNTSSGFPDTSVNTAVTLALDKSAIYFDVIGGTENLKALVTPQSQNVTWTSSNPSVATVQNGTVTATGNGTAVITATAGNQSASLTVTVSQRTNKISLTLNNQSFSGTLKVRVRKSYNFKAKVEPANADSKNKKVEWKSSNTKIATIKNGKVTIKKSGTVTITEKTGDGKTAKIKLKSSKNPVKVTRIKISGNKSMGAKSKQNLKLMITPATADNSKVTWSSSDKKIATVDKNGKVAAKKKGTVTITAKAKDGSGKKGTLKIKVK